MTADSKKSSLINYGLFEGTFNYRLLNTPLINNIYMTCLIDDNVCALSCKALSAERKKEVQVIYSGYSVSKSCDANGTSDGNRIEEKLVWFNGGVYISTLLFLSLALFMSSVSAVFGLYNTTKSPVEPLMGIFGLYIWNGLSALFSLMVLLLWGIHYETTVTENLSFTQIMISTDDYTSISSHLGFSYWLVLISILCHIANEGMLGGRYYLIRKEPPPPVINIENNTNDTIFLY